MISARLDEITDGMRGVLGDAIAELVGDHRLLDLLGAAIQGNVTTVLHMLCHHVPLAEVPIPTAAVAHARRLAQQGVPVFAMVRAYRLGQAHLLEETFAELSRGDADPRLALTAYNAINVRTLAYIDRVSQEVVTVYETERDQWVRTQDAVRAARIQEIVAGRGGDETEAEGVLRHPLRQHHVAAVLWTDDDTSSEGRLEAAVAALAPGLGGPGPGGRSAPLSAPADRGTTWAWFPRGPDDTDPDVPAVAAVLSSARFDGVRVALGGAGSGLDGFRDSHRQAVEAQRVLLVGGHGARRAVGYREPGVAAAALLAHDVERTRVMVRAVLGPLAADDPASERLRETLLGFLEAGSSYTAAAARQSLHKNSVKYRVERALAQRGRPLGDDRVDVEVALVACRWLGGALR